MKQMYASGPLEYNNLIWFCVFRQITRLRYLFLFQGWIILRMILGGGGVKQIMEQYWN